MKKLILIFIAINTLSCNHNIPIAKIEFIKIQKDKEIDDYFDLYFSSNKELINSLNDYAYIQLDCFFQNKKITKKDYKKLNNYTLSSVGELKLVSKTTDYNYIINTFFKNNGSSVSTNEERQKTKSSITELININDDCLSCVITAVALMNTKERYISDTMCLPKIEIRKVIN